jgi:hypothetical protein
MRLRYHGAIMTFRGADESKTKFSYPKMNLREVHMKYGRSVVFKRHYSAEI